MKTFALALFVAGSAVGQVSIGIDTGALRFAPITPCRIADTRNPNTSFGGPAIAKGATREFVIPKSACGIPSNVASYSMNVAVVPHGTLGFLTLWPSGQPQPLVATLNSIDGRAKSNAAIVPAGSNGAVSVFATDTTDLILDINFVGGDFPGALAFYPLTPCRVADTRNPTDPLGGPSLEAQSTRSFPIVASSCGVPPEAEAYSLNLAAIPKGPTLGYITVWPVGQSQPLVASLNDPNGTVAANAVIISAGPGGAVNVFTTDATDLVIDINGYFAPADPLPLRPPSKISLRSSGGSTSSILTWRSEWNIFSSPSSHRWTTTSPDEPRKSNSSKPPNTTKAWGWDYRAHIKIGASARTGAGASS